MAYSARIKSPFIKPEMCLLHSNLVCSNDLNLRQLFVPTSSAKLDPVTAPVSFMSKTYIGGCGTRSKLLRGFHLSR